MKTYRDIINKSLNLIKSNEKEEKALYFLLEDVIKKPLSYILANQEKVISEDILKEFSDKFYEYLIDDKPIQYVLGYTYFYDLKLKTKQGVFIPRKESEELVEKTINILKNKKDLLGVDVGVGSGNIALSLKKHLDVYMYGVDKNKEALSLTKENGKENNLEIKLIRGEFLNYFSKNKIKVDFVISNPPYISFDDKEVDENVLKYEPKEALFSKKNGLYHIENILLQSKQVVKKGGYIFLEIGYNQKESLKQVVKKIMPKSELNIYKDMSGLDRIAIIKYY